MASSGYTAITFVADELLTSTKMNLMAANDAAFNNGNGFEDSIIKTRHLGSAANLQIPADRLAFVVGRLAIVRKTTNSVSTAGTTSQAGFEISITVPNYKNGIRVIVGGGNNIKASATDNNFGLNMYSGTSLGGTQRTAGAFANGGNTALQFPPFVIYEHEPTVGSTQVYSLGIFSSGGSVATWVMNSTAPGYMIVEAY